MMLIREEKVMPSKIRTKLYLIKSQHNLLKPDKFSNPLPFETKNCCTSIMT